MPQVWNLAGAMARHVRFAGTAAWPSAPWPQHAPAPRALTAHVVYDPADSRHHASPAGGSGASSSPLALEPP